MATVQQDILNRYSKVAVIGAGVIGASWTALFLAHGLAVVVNDPRPDVEVDHFHRTEGVEAYAKAELTDEGRS